MSSRTRLVVVLIALIVAVPVLGLFVPAHMPLYESVRAAWRPSQARLLGRHGELLQTLRMDYRERRGAWTALADIPEDLLKAVIASEDRRFYEHSGVDLRALLHAGWQALAHGSRRGASTLSMQLAALLDPDLQGAGARGLPQKWRQMRSALTLERHWTKREILEAYLNRASYRGELRGIAAVSRALFDKEPVALDAIESRLIVAMLPAPNAPMKSVAARACRQAAGIGHPADCEAIQRRAAALPTSRVAEPAVGDARELAVKLLNREGQAVTTTLDAELQRRVQALLREQIAVLAERDVHDGAVLVVDNSSGDVLAYVGNAGAQSSARYVDGVRAQRQAGSTLKPFLYELAIESRLLTAASLLDDSPLQLPTPAGIYRPRDYEQETRGAVSLRTALASSLNLPAVRTLALMGITPFHARLLNLGYELPESADHYGYALALGSADVSLWEQVQAYRVLARGGLYSPLRVIRDGPVAQPRRLMPEQAAYVVSDILSDRAARSLTFGLENPLTTHIWTAVKTGTSKDLRDNWCMGYSRRYTVGVWVGNFDGHPMHDVSGITGAAPLWSDVMALLADSGSDEAGPALPDGVVRSEVRFPDSKESARMELFLAGTEIGESSAAPVSDRLPRIDYPTPGMLLALDPDIPPDRQLLFFRARGDREHLKWVLDRQALGSAQADYRWVPTAGAHEISLMDPSGQVLDRLQFSVRGATGTSLRQR